MSRRASLPGAAELFRATGPGGLDEAYEANGPRRRPARRRFARSRTCRRARRHRARRPIVRAQGCVRPLPVAATSTDRRPSGRERHDEKITVYVSGDELFDLEQARLVLRGSHGLAVDRGRIVREALALVIADLDAKGESSILVRRLRQG